MLVAEERGAEVRLAPTRANLRQQQAAQPLSPVADVIRCHDAPGLSLSVGSDRMIPEKHRPVDVRSLGIRSKPVPIFAIRAGSTRHGFRVLDTCSKYSLMRRAES